MAKGRLEVKTKKRLDVAVKRMQAIRELAKKRARDVREKAGKRNIT